MTSVVWAMESSVQCKWLLRTLIFDRSREREHALPLCKNFTSMRMIRNPHGTNMQDLSPKPKWCTYICRSIVYQGLPHGCRTQNMSKKLDLTKHGTYQS